MTARLKLGILDAVPSRFLHVDNYISDAEKFLDLFEDVGFCAECVVFQAAEGSFPSDVNACDAYLITGSPLGVHDDEAWIGHLMDFVRAVHAARKRLVGICFGHELIAQALGGEVRESAQGWMLGLLGFKILENPGWMEASGSTAWLYHANKDQVMILPPEAKQIGTSNRCKFSMYTIGSHILCIQGHPEQPLRAVHNYIQELGDTVPPEVVAKARQSLLGAEPDKLRVGRWIRDFLGREPDGGKSI